MSQCALCGDKRKNIRWFVNGRPVCKRHYDRISHIKEVFKIKVKFEELPEPMEEVVENATDAAT
jgi:hypothetical protein